MKLPNTNGVAGGEKGWTAVFSLSNAGENIVGVMLGYNMDTYERIGALTHAEAMAVEAVVKGFMFTTKLEAENAVRGAIGWDQR